MEAPRNRAQARGLVFWLVLAVAAVLVVVQVVEGPPGSGYGWGSVAVSCVLLVVPLAVLALMVRSGERRFAWASMAVAVLMTALVLAALVGNWNGQPSTDRVLDSVAALLTLAASAGVLRVELPLARRS
jgi:uncharacterized PurR-regulated membrane protein YhhQ (DUF165 family)